MQTIDARRLAVGLREFADYAVAHPHLILGEGNISFYRLSTSAEAVEIMESHPSAEIVECSSGGIDYLRLTFGALRVDHIVKKEILRIPRIVNERVIYVLRPEFDKVQP